MNARLWCIGIATMFGLGCSEPTSPRPKVAVVSVVPDTASVEVRDTIRLSAVLRDSLGRPVSGVGAQWSSSDTTLARVSATGLVVGAGPGVAWIRAAAGGLRDSARVSVLVPVASLRVVPAAVTFVKGSSVLLSPVPLDSAGNYLWGRVTWTSSDTTKATVAGGATCDIGPAACGLGTARGAGLVTITAAAGHKRAAAQLTLAVVTFTSLTSAEEHTCGLSNLGDVWCWGLNTVGELAVPNVRFPRTTPGLVRGGLSFNQVSAGGAGTGGFTCAATTGGFAYCWGLNDGSGQLGSIAPTPDTVPTPVNTGLQFTIVRSGAAHACGLALGNAPYCWGNNGSHILGNDTLSYDAAFAPVAVAGQFRFTALAVGGAHACGLTYAGVAYCWGYNSRGQLGSDSAPTNSSFGPRIVLGARTFSSITAGDAHTCGLTAAGAAYCWGSNNFGELGNGDTADSHVPVPVSGGLAFRTIAAGPYSTCGITVSGTAHCWGWNWYGQLGTNAASGTNDAHPVPSPVLGGLQFSSIETGAGVTCGLTTAGLAYCWGKNTSGQLGDGTYNMASVPVLVVGQQ